MKTGNGILLLGGIPAVLAAGPALAGSESARPNIILVVADDLGWSDLVCYGADLHETPNIDRLASRSVVFTNGYAAAPVCSPTRASLLTGKCPARLHMTIWSEAASPAERKNQEVYRFLPPQTLENLPLEETTLAEVLRDTGYLTAHVGKWHVGDLMHFPETQGFDVSFAASQRGAPPTYFYPYRGEAFGEYRFVKDLGKDANGNYFTDRKGEYLTDRLTDEAMKIMQDAGKRSFYLNLWFYNVHTPLEAKEKDVAYFVRKKIGKQFNHMHETYAAMVKALDDNVGRLVRKTEELGIAGNTIIIFLSDNGGYINEYKGRPVTSNYPLRSGKGSLYEGGIRVPIIVYRPDHPGKGRKVDVPVSTIDIFPTVLEMTGIQARQPVDGRSFLKCLDGKEDTALRNRFLCWHYPHYYPTTSPVSAIREGNYKLLEYLEDGHLELYNLADDLGETRNLAAAEPGRAAQMLQKLQAWKTGVKAQGITVNPAFRESSASR